MQQASELFRCLLPVVENFCRIARLLYRGEKSRLPGNQSGSE